MKPLSPLQTGRLLALAGILAALLPAISGAARNSRATASSKSKTQAKKSESPAASARVPATPAPKISFNFQVRPILAENCYACHGPDEKKRKGKLRLDVEAEAVAKGAIKPGDPDESEAIKRLFTQDEDDVMPPPESRHQMTEAQKELLKRWVAQGGHYETHWAFVAPQSPPVPQLSKVSNEDVGAEATGSAKSASKTKPAGKAKSAKKSENENGGSGPSSAAAAPGDFNAGSAIDSFVLQRLQKEGIRPAPKADRATWLRRVTLDLVGLPPTPEEIEAFLKEPSEQSYERVVDRLLASPAYGERMASDWLDAARYADTYGRHEDAESPVWPYRDWVVRAFNGNMPYSQFLTEQTAGDLLPNPTQDQLVATVFNRLVQQSNEAGSNEEEFRQEHVADRVRTNATAILGLSVECARCHDHKYDPITMKDYYGFSAFLNNINELGLYSRQTSGIPAPSVLLEDADTQEKVRTLKEETARAEAQLQQIREAAAVRYAAWQRQNGLPRAAAPTAWYRFEFRERAKKSELKIITDEMNPQDPGMSRVTPELVQGPPGHGTALLVGGDFPISFGNRGVFRRSDAFSFSLWYRPGEAQERSVLLHRTRGGLDAASRGYEVILENMFPEFSLSHFAPENSIRIRGKEKLLIGQWTHLGVTYDGSSKAAGMRLYLNGKPVETTVVSDNLYRDILYRKEWGDFDTSKIQDNGTPVVDLSLAWRYNDMGVKNGAFDEFKVFDRQLSLVEMAGEADVTSDTTPESWFVAYLRDHDAPWQEAWKKVHDLRTAQDDVANNAQELMVMKEAAVPRETHVMLRGQWDQPGEIVTADVPLKLFPMPAGLPKNRLGLAKWYVDRNNPLTARVFVNRLWQMFFGRGLVGTAEEFGIQGDLPTHPELLDWLACDFMDHGWNVKRLCKQIALSSTYRQSSVPTDKRLLQEDPQNRLLGRGPRFRLSAEQLRDTALSAAGLLVRTMGGPPVKPYQTPNLYADSGVQSPYEQDHGEALWRRSVYCFWKRTMPLPTLTVFDGPTREFCKMRRERTNTPLQALALLNAPEFVECARVLAQRQLKQFPGDAIAQIRDAFLRCTGREISPAETAELQSLLKEQQEYYTSHPADAETFLKNAGEAPVEPNLTPMEVAALSMVTRVLLSHDATVVKQ